MARDPWAEFTPVQADDPWAEFDPAQVDDPWAEFETAPEPAPRAEMRAAPQSTFERYVENPVRRGVGRLKQAITTGLRDEENPERYAVSMARLNREQEAAGQSIEDQEAIGRIAEAEDFGEFLSATWDRPDVIGQTIVESLATFAPALVGTAIASTAGPGGTAAAAGLGSGATEYMISMTDAIGEAGGDPSDPRAWLQAIQDEKVVDAAKDKAFKRGVSIGVIDAVTAGLAGKLLAGSKGGIVSPTARVGGEVGVQMGGGATGETLAQLQTQDKLQIGEIGLEAIAEGPTAAIEVPANIKSAREAYAAKAPQREAERQTDAYELETAALDAAASPDDPNVAENLSLTQKAFDKKYGRGEAEKHLGGRSAVETGEDLGAAAEAPVERPPAEMRATAVAVNPQTPAVGTSEVAQNIKQSAEGLATFNEVNQNVTPMTPEQTDPQAVAAMNATVDKVQAKIDEQAQTAAPPQAAMGFQVNEAIQPTPELATAIETFNFPLQEYQQIAAQATGGRPRTATGDQLRTIDSMWQYMESQLETLANAGYDTKELIAALKKASGMHSIKGKLRAKRGDQPVTGRIKSGNIAPLGGQSKNTPEGGWGAVANTFYTRVYKALNNMLQNGPANPPTGGITVPGAAPAPQQVANEPVVEEIEAAPPPAEPVTEPVVEEIEAAPAPEVIEEAAPAVLTPEQQAVEDAKDSGYKTTPEEEAAILQQRASQEEAKAKAAEKALAEQQARRKVVTDEEAAAQAAEATTQPKSVAEVSVATKRRPKKAQAAIEAGKKRAAAKKGKITLKKKEPAKRETEAAKPEKPTARPVAAPKKAPAKAAAKSTVTSELKNAKAKGFASVAAMKSAEAQGIPASEIKGTGSKGAITKANVESARIARANKAGGEALKAAMQPTVTEEVVEEVEAAPAPEDTAALDGYANREDIIDARLDGVEALELALGADTEITGGDLMRSLAGALESSDPYQQLIKALQKTAAADTPIRTVSSEEMLIRTGKNSSGNYRRKRVGDSIYRDIVLNDGMFDGNWGSRAVKTTLHELVHAATAEGMRTDNATAQAMEKLRKSTINHLRKTSRAPQANEYGFRNVDEFVAEALSNQDFQRILATTPGTGGKSVWQNFIDAIANFLGIPVDANTALAEVMALAPDLMMTTAEVEAEHTRKDRGEFLTEWVARDALAPTAAEIEEMMRGGPDLERAKITSNARNLGNNTVARAAGAVYDATRGKVDLREGWRAGQRAGLGLHTLDQIVRRFKTRFQAGDGNALADYDRIQRRKSTYARDKQQEAEKLNQKWRDFEKSSTKEQAQELSQLMQDATMTGVHPDLAFFNRLNEHAWDDTNLERAHTRMQERFNALPPKARAIYREARGFYVTQREEMRQASLRHIARANRVNDTDLAAAQAAKTAADIEALDLSYLGEEADRVKEALSQVTKLTSVQGPYFPLRRFGRYVVEGTREGKMVGSYAKRGTAWIAARKLRADEPYSKVRTRKLPDGTYTNEKITRTVEMYDRITDADARAAELTAEGFKGRKGAAVTSSLKEEWGLPPGSGANVLLTQAKRKFDDDSPQARALETAFLELLLENSLRKSELQRKKVAGASLEMRRAFAERAYAGSWGIADVNTALDHDRAIKDMAKAARNDVAMGEVVSELRTRDSKAMGDRKISKLEAGISQYGFLNYLSSPSYTMVNLTQVPLVAGPYLQAKFGTKSWAEMAKVYKSIMGAAGKEWARVAGGLKGAPENILEVVTNAPGTTAPEKQMIKDLAGLGIIDATFMQELYKTASGAQETMFGRGWNKVMDVARASPQVAEVVNRVVVGRAAFNLAVQKGADYETARDAASEAVLQTQFDYTDQNKPRYFKAFPGARAIMMFKMYAQGMYALIGSSAYNSIKGTTAEKKAEARKMFAGLIASHSLAGGVLGGLFIEPVRMLISLAELAFEGDDEPWDLDHEVTQALAELTGSPAMAEVITRGLPRAVGVDLSGRVGLDHMAMMGQRDARSAQEGFKDFLIALGGPIPAAGLNIARGVDYFNKGEIARGIESGAPKFVRDVMKAGRYADEGMLDYNGNIIRGKQNFGTSEYASQVLGLQSAEAARTYEARTAQKGYETKIRDRRKLLMQTWRRKNPKERAAYFRNTIVPFNKKNPEFVVTVGKLISGLVEQKRREARTRAGAFTEKIATRRRGEAYNVQ